MNDVWLAIILQFVHQENNFWLTESLQKISESGTRRGKVQAAREEGRSMQRGGPAGPCNNPGQHSLTLNKFSSSLHLATFPALHSVVMFCDVLLQVAIDVII